VYIHDNNGFVPNINGIDMAKQKAIANKSQHTKGILGKMKTPPGSQMPCTGR
jgi:hypothetical protein